ncbi:PfkB family carbohydrate kinase [Seohaeicola zhoushanensis]
MIHVFGSINVDFVFRMRRMPGPGETVMADESLTLHGGKGANQAVAAARALGRPGALRCTGRWATIPSGR